MEPSRPGGWGAGADWVPNARPRAGSGKRAGGRGKAGRKPGSVPIAPPGTGRSGDGGGSSLSNRRCRRPPAAQKTEQDNWPTVVPWAEALALLPAGVYRAGTSRCRWCALTAPLHPCLCPEGPSAVCFCGTLLTVSRTGRYPAGLAIGEPGLSSTGSPGPTGENSHGSEPVAITSPAF